MTEVHIRHTGSRTLAVAVPGGMLTVKPGTIVGPLEVSPLSEEQVELYRSKGLFFSGAPADGKKADKSAGGKKRQKGVADKADTPSQQLDLDQQGDDADDGEGDAGGDDEAGSE
jgi:hypothetical protein